MTMAVTQDEVIEALQLAWDEWVSDGLFKIEIGPAGKKRLWAFFEKESNFTQSVTGWLNNVLARRGQDDARANENV